MFSKISCYFWQKNIAGMLNINIDATYPSAGSTNPEVELRYAEIDFETGSVSNYKLVTALSKVIFSEMPRLKLISLFSDVQSLAISATFFKCSK